MIIASKFNYVLIIHKLKESGLTVITNHKLKLNCI